MSPPNKELWAAASQELSLRIMDLVRESPFWGHVLGGIRRRLSMTVPTAGVAWTPDGIELLVNPQYFLHGLKGPPQRRGLIRHEALHIIFLHPVRCFRPGDHPILTNIAADLVVNHCIPAQELWDGALRSYDFPDLIKTYIAPLEYFFSLLDALWKQMAQVDPIAAAAGDWSSTSAPKSAAQLAQIMARWSSREHEVWAWRSVKVDDAAEFRRAVAETNLIRRLRDARARVGPATTPIPKPVLKHLEVLRPSIPPARIDWRRMLRLFAARSGHSTLAQTQSRFSKRFGSSPGVRVRRRRSLVVAVDTSGSISETLMHAFFAEIHRLWREQVDVTIVECDFRVTASYPYTGKVPASVQGRRGTSFEPVFQWMQGKSYDGCIYLTDGEGPAPRTRPACLLLWVVTQKEQIGEHLRWGRAIHLPVEE